MTFFIPTAIIANDEYYRHIFFDNSLTSDFYFYSSAAALAPSKLEQKNFKLPVETATFLTPPNALRLEWQPLSRTARKNFVHLVFRPAGHRCRRSSTAKEAGVASVFLNCTDKTTRISIMAFILRSCEHLIEKFPRGDLKRV